MKSKAKLQELLMAALTPIRKTTVSEWADKYRQLPSESAEPGQWKTSRVPYMKAVMDACTDNNIHRIVMKSAAQVGKALALDTRIPTPEGWSTMGELQAGDKVFDEQGNICNVVAVSPVWDNRPCYELTFSDGAKIIADAEHEWLVDKNNHGEGKGSLILTTREIANTYKNKNRNNYAIPVSKPLVLPEVDLPLDGYTLGLWLGDGHSAGARLTLHEKDAEIVGYKHIPVAYLRASIETRWELLCGLLDTDGHINPKNGRCEFVQKNLRLAENVMELIRSLGLKPTIQKKKAICRISFHAYRTETERRRIVEVKRAGNRATRCIQVDSPSHLFLAGEAMIPSHNSEALLNIIGYYAHTDPATIMLVQPTLEQAQDFSQSRLKKMIQDTKVLTPLFYTKQETILSKYFKGGRIVLQGANSAAGLASRPIRILLCDEVDRFPATASGNEGDPVSLAAKRQTTYWNYRTILTSTPTNEGSSRIEVEYLAGTQEEWRHRCPNCGEYHKLDYRQMKADYSEARDEYGNKTVIVRSVKWQCPDCGWEFGELEMKRSPQKYVAQNPDALINGIRSFWLNGFSSPWLTWSAIMREYYEARGNPQMESVVHNTRFGETYALRGEYDDENVFLARREDYPAELPQGVLLLVAGVDVQANRLEYEIVGYGVGEESWGILRGLVRGSPNEIGTWQALDEILDREYRFANGAGLKVARTFIDSGYATRSVYEYCGLRGTSGRFAIKGVGTIGVPLLYKYGNPRGSGILLTMLGVNDGKQAVMSDLGINSPGARFMHFPNDDEHLGRRGYDSVYFKQLISEHRVTKKSGGIIQVVWEKIDPSARNESLDCRVYALASMRSCIGKSGEEFWKKQAEGLYSQADTTKKAPVRKPVASRDLQIWN